VDRAGPFLFIGERLAFDFINTEWMEAGAPVDRLRRFEDLVAWAVAADVVDRRQVAGRQWSNAAKQRAFALAISLRAALREAFERTAARRPAPPRAIDAINEVLRLRAGALELSRTAAGYATTFTRPLADPVELLVPVAESAAEVLSADDPALIRKCQSPDCVLYFVDTTKSHRRRWCSMAACGNRAKAAAHYRRQRSGAS
jgi:predicted RNA-binding Zn ribbon-like protein